MAAAWRKAIDAVLIHARAQMKHILLDFSAAPMCGACARLDAEVYPDERVAQFINTHLVSSKMHSKEHPEALERFGAQWTPTLVILDPEGKENRC